MAKVKVDVSGGSWSNAGMDTNAAYQELIEATRQVSMLGSISAVLDWDEQTHLPPQGVEFRANQSSFLAGLAHQRLTSPAIGDRLAALEESPATRDPHSDAAVNILHIRRDYDRARKLPAALVEEMARTTVLAQQAWAQARQKSDFPAFAPWLDRVMALKRQEAACIGSASGSPYDALLDKYEPGATSAQIADVFESLRQPLVTLIGKIARAPRQAPIEVLERSFPVDRQEAFAREAAAAIGFDFTAGRLDTSVHPFCSGIAPGDTRMTTRYDDHYFGDAFFGVLHETGHGMYEQGLPREHFGTPRGRAVSLGIHESQSRLWENLVGRSRPFWTFFLPKLRVAFGESLAGVNDDDWYFAINDVRPSFIRVEADEATYNLHILLRFEMEQAILAGSISAADVPALWNQKMQTYLGITPPDDARGCLQDVHWSAGLVGYFPTYTLGNLYAAQFMRKARQDLADLESHFSRGDFTPLLDWLRKHVHQHGQKYSGAELVRNATGQDLTAEPLLQHLAAKASELYGV